MGLAALPSKADVTFYDVTKIRTYTQNSNAQPLSPDFYFLDARIGSNNLDDFTNVIAQYGDSDGPPQDGDPPIFVPGPLSPLTVVSPTQTFYRSPNYTDKSQFDTDFPNGSIYRFDISGGTLGDQFAFLSFPETDLYPTEIPFLTGTTFSQLQGLDPSQPFTFTINGFSPVPEALFNNLGLTILRSSDSQIPFEQFFLSSTTTSIEIPANILDPDTEYTFNLDYRADILTGGLGDAGGFGNFLSRTLGVFTTGSTVGTTPDNPFLPIFDPNNPDGFTFSNISVFPDLMLWFDPDVAVGYDYTVTGGPLFASVLIPSALPGGDSDFILELPSFGSFPLLAGTPFDLLQFDPLGFDSFRITGIDPAELLDPTDPLAFVTGLTFTEAGTVTVTQNPIVENIATK